MAETPYDEAMEMLLDTYGEVPVPSGGGRGGGDGGGGGEISTSVADLQARLTLVEELVRMSVYACVRV